MAQRLGQRVTHVIVDLDDLSRLPAIRKMNRVSDNCVIPLIDVVARDLTRLRCSIG